MDGFVYVLLMHFMSENSVDYGSICKSQSCPFRQRSAAPTSIHLHFETTIEYLGHRREPDDAYTAERRQRSSSCTRAYAPGRLRGPIFGSYNDVVREAAAGEDGTEGARVSALGRAAMKHG